MMNVFLTLNNVAKFPELPPQILNLLGHSVIVYPEVLKKLQTVDHPHILACYGNMVDELTGAVIAGEGRQVFEQMAFLVSQKGWMERSVILLVSKHRHIRFFSYMWHRRIANIIQFTGTELYTYDPFRACFVKLEPQDAWKTMNERWRDLRGHKIPVVVYPHKYSFRRDYGISPGGGIDGTAIYELAKHWNMTVVLKYVIGDENRMARSNALVPNFFVYIFN